MTKLKKKLNTYGLTMIAIGSCIGAGIFTAPGQDSPVSALPEWIDSDGDLTAGLLSVPEN